MNRLFLPLTSIWHELFKSGHKTWELRKVSNRFNEKTVVVGRDVELRRGYKYDPIFGTITDVAIVDSWDNFSDDIKIGIFPKVVDEKESIEFLNNYLKNSVDTKLIAFKIKI